MKLTIKTLAEQLGHPSQDVNILRNKWISCPICKGLWSFKYFRDNKPKCDILREAIGEKEFQKPQRLTGEIVPWDVP